MTSLSDAYSPENFRKQGHTVIDLLADQLAQTLSGDGCPVIQMTEPEDALQEFDQFLNSTSEPRDIESLFKKIFARSIRLHHPHYMGHQISPPIPAAALASLLSDLLNNGMGVYEMGIAGTAIERHVIKSLASKFGYGSQADGFLTSGGTLGNLTALLAARRAKASTDVWKAGNTGKLAVMVSEQAHYCIDKAVRVMGWGDDGIILIPTQPDFSMDVNSMESQLRTAAEQGFTVIAVVGSACSTATGSFDDLSSIGEFCKKHDLWFHVDGAHGAATIYSDTYRHRLDGIELADSVTMDFHKLLMTPALATAVVFKDGRYAAQNFAQKADYLWSDANPDDQWHDLARRTFECTKSMVSVKIFTILYLYGEDIFGQNVTTLYQSTERFADLIAEQPDFELATQPQANILCFRFCPNSYAGDLDELNLTIRAQLTESGDFYIVQTKLKNTVWLRCTIANPFSDLNHFSTLLDSIRNLA